MTGCVGVAFFGFGKKTARDVGYADADEAFLTGDSLGWERRGEERS